HEVDVERPSAERAQVRLRDRAEIPNRDFVLRWTVAGEDLREGVFVHRTGDADGHLSLVLLPPERVPAEHAAPKEVLFVVDRSGSQSGAPLAKAKETIRFVLDHLNPNDTFQVIDFGSTSRALFDVPQRVSAAMREETRSFVDSLEPYGGALMAE